MLVRAAIDADQAGDAVVVHDEKRRGWSPHRQQARKLLEPLFGVDMEAFPLWGEYRAHVRRRNDVVHDGQAVDRESAAASLKITRALWLWLNKAATANGLTVEPLSE